MNRAIVSTTMIISYLESIKQCLDLIGENFSSFVNEPSDAAETFCTRVRNISKTIEVIISELKSQKEVLNANRAKGWED